MQEHLRNNPLEPVNALTPVIKIVNSQAITTSISISEFFGKRHKDVLRAIRDLDVPTEFTERNFAPSEYDDITGRKLSMYEMTRDGFTVLAMGFTGRAAMKFKLAYIEAFNRMEERLRSDRPLPPPLPESKMVIEKDRLIEMQEAIIALQNSEIARLKGATPSRQRVSPEETRRIVALRSSGCSYAAIAKAVGRKKETVETVLRRERRTSRFGGVQ